MNLDLDPGQLRAQIQAVYDALDQAVAALGTIGLQVNAAETAAEAAAEADAAEAGTPASETPAEPAPAADDVEAPAES